MKTYLSILLLITCLSTYAQNTIKPGDKLINYDQIKPAHDFYKNTITDTLGNVTYEFMMENLITIDRVNQQITFARSRQVPVGSFATDTSVTSLQLKPIRMHEIFYQRGANFDMQFADEQAVVKTTRKGVLSVKTYLMQSGYFEDNMIEYIFGYLQLKKNITYTLNNFNKDTPKPADPYTLTYLFDDVWTLAPGRLLTCRVIHFTHGDTSGYIWIDKDTNNMLKEQGDFKTGSFLLVKM